MIEGAKSANASIEGNHYSPLQKWEGEASELAPSLLTYLPSALPADWSAYLPARWARDKKGRKGRSLCPSI